MKKSLLILTLSLVTLNLFGQKERKTLLPRVHKTPFVLAHHYFKIDYQYAFGNENILSKPSFNLGYHYKRKFNGEEFRFITGLEYQYRSLSTSFDDNLMGSQYHGFVIPTFIRTVYHARCNYWLDVGINNYIVLHAQETDNIPQQDLILNNNFQPSLHLALGMSFYYSRFAET
ncbi:MAG: hypothetical protein AB8G11_13225 [Saprospiraceae bacterium]